MSDWKECKLGDVAEITSSKRIFYAEYVSNGVPFYRSKEIIDLYNKRNISTELFISEKKYNEIKENYGVPVSGDILLTSVGSLGIPYKVSNQDRFYFKDGNLTWFRNIETEVLYTDYLLLWLKSAIGKQKLDEITIGSTQPALTISGLKNIEILLPPLPEQKAIADVLSSLDDKNDLLHRQNKTLEAMAEALFRQWFVEDVGVACKYKQLDEVAIIQNGYSFNSSDYIENTGDCLEVFKMGHIEKGGGLRTNPKRDYVVRNDKLSRWILNRDDIVMAMTDMKDNVVILGVPAVIDKNDIYVLNQRVARIYLKSNTELINKYFLYLQLKNPEFVAELQSKANSGVQVNLSTDVIKSSEIIIPPINIQIEKGQVIIDLYEKKEKNDIQIKSLKRLRDTLLPKLMSGEVRVEI